MTTLYIALAIGAGVPAYPAFVAFQSPYRFVDGATFVLPEPAPVALAQDGTGSVTVPPGVWLVQEILPTQVFRRAVVVPDVEGVVQYASLIEVTSPVEVGYGPSWAALAEQAAIVAGLARDESKGILASLRKGEAGGTAGLNTLGVVPDDQLPSRLLPSAIYALVGDRLSQEDIPQQIIDATADILADSQPLIDAAATRAAQLAAADLGLVRVSSASGAEDGLFERSGVNGAELWKDDTGYVEKAVGTTLPGRRTRAALSFLRFLRGVEHAISGVGISHRAAGGRRTALETSDQYDPVTGIVPLSLDAEISLGHVTLSKRISGTDLAKLVPRGRRITHEQPDGWHWIDGEKD